MLRPPVGHCTKSLPKGILEVNDHRPSLAKHSDPMFPHLWACFWNHGFCGSNTKRMWFLGLCRLLEQSISVPKCGCGCNCMCSCVVVCMLAWWTSLYSDDQFSIYSLSPR